MRIDLRLKLCKNMKFTFGLIVCLVACHRSSGELHREKIRLHTNLTLDYFIARGIRNVVMFLCWSHFDYVNLIKTFSRNNIRVSLPIINNRMLSINQDINKIFEEFNRIGVVFDSCCYAVILKKYPYFTSSYAWLILDCNHSNVSLIQSLPLSISSDLIITKTEDDLKHVDLYDAYKIGHLKLDHIGRWSEMDSGWKKYFDRSQVKRRRNLFGNPIKVVTLTENNLEGTDTHTYLIDNMQLHLDTVFKMNYQMILLLKEMYNFTIEFVMADNWSNRNSKGVYRSDNLLGVLATNRADIMAGALFMKLDRLPISDSLYMTYPLRCGFVFLNSGELDGIRATFYLPFSDTVWGCYALVVLLVILITSCVLKYENVYISGNIRMFCDFGEIVLSVIGACCQMGTNVTPITSASRLVYFTFFFTSTLIYNFYTSSIVSTLITSKEEKFSIVDLANSDMRCGSFDVGFMHNLLFDLPTPAYPNMAYFNSKKKKGRFYIPIQEGIDNVKRGGFAYHAEFNSIYRVIENRLDSNEICELKEIETMPSEMMAILGSKNSTYTEMFKFGLNRAAETGHLNKEIKKWFSKKPACQMDLTFSQVRLKQIISIHILLCIGVILSLIVVFVEKFKYRAKQVRGKKVINIRKY